MGLTVILVDTSAWIEYLRDTGSLLCERVDDLIRDDELIATTDVVIMELLMGAPGADARRKIWAFLNRCEMYPVRPLFDFEKAAGLYVRCRQDGFTPANTNHLLLASVAISRKVPVLAADSDFEGIAAVSTLKLAA